MKLAIRCDNCQGTGFYGINIRVGADKLEKVRCTECDGVGSIDLRLMLPYLDQYKTRH